MKNIPVSFAMGAMSFFLVLASSSFLSTQVSLPHNRKQKKEMMNKVKELLTVNIGDGLRQFITYQRLPSLTSQGIKALQI
jgi:biopolymer transport protein ExbD